MRDAVFSFLVASIAASCVVVAGCSQSTSRTDDRAVTVAPSVGTVSVAVRPVVTWPATDTADERTLLSLADTAKSEREVRASIARSPVPVLAPKDLRLASPTLVVEGEYFALTGRYDGATISLQGTRAAHRYEGVDPATGNKEIIRGSSASKILRAFVSTNEGIRTASWIENGVAYSVDVECSDPREARCQSDEFLLAIIAQLTFIGGSGR